MNIIDLFSGAGGLTFGFYFRKKGNQFVRNKKNEFIFANEYDENAADAFKKNYPDIAMINSDIKELTDEKIAELINNQPVDIIIGGPPCQSFSTVGQRIYDEKATLYQEYLRILRIARPKMFLFENVTGILSMRETFYKRDKDGNIEYEEIANEEAGKIKKKPVIKGYGRFVIDVIKEKFANIDDSLGYNIVTETLNAVDYGVPENRERVFIVGIRNDLNIDWSFPEKLKTDKITVKEAISDLPRVSEGQKKEKYTIEPKNPYQVLMRNGSVRITQHYCGIYGEKIQIVIKNVKQGQGRNDFNKLVDEGKIGKKYYLTSGYANTYGRLVANLPSTTITNNLSTPSGLRCIHYSQNRALTPREGARIQSFPDWFEFCGHKVNVTSQIGNAVPPLLSLELAKSFEKAIKGK